MTDPSILRRIANDDHARRELLWLRAKAKGHALAARDLEHVDPALVSRLRAAGAGLGERPGERASERRERFERLWDECWKRHERRLDAR